MGTDFEPFKPSENFGLFLVHMDLRTVVRVFQYDRLSVWGAIYAQKHRKCWEISFKVRNVF